ncbi:hypothetical protein [Moorena sp. SIO3H5]|uniref:hypothetical protein n=1 Tax=Moorena sp. SIO3H5 TaxID=2607834 RepID=UPI0013B878C0|nr:hypothetical protein [Moorena sp. SIO3H5]NEO69687.1 hypothetical protein [Moorena sp. SIO3H5]
MTRSGDGSREIDVQLIHEYTNIRESLPSEGRDSRELVECTILLSKLSTTPGDIEISEMTSFDLCRSKS